MAASSFSASLVASLMETSTETEARPRQAAMARGAAAASDTELPRTCRPSRSASAALSRRSRMMTQVAAYYTYVLHE